MHRLRILALILLLALTTQSFGAIGITQAATAGPVVLSTLPVDNSSTVPANAQFTLNFSEPVQRGASGTISIREVNTNNAVASLDVPTNYANIQLNAANTSVTFTSSTALAAGVDYYVQITPGAFTGPSGSFGGITDATAWNFRTIAVDNTSLSVAAFDPVPGSSSLQGTGALTLTFNKNVDATSGNIQIIRRDTGDTQLISVLSPSVTGAGTNVIRIQPQTRLVSGAQYDVLIDANAFADGVGNKYGGISAAGVWSFRTAAPLIAAPSVSPIGVTNAAPSTLQMQFSVPMKKGAGGNLYVKNLSNNQTVQTIAVTSNNVNITNNSVNITLVQSLALNTAYYVMMDSAALLDASNNPYEGIADTSTWRFSTLSSADTTPPTVAVLTPTSGSTTNALNGALTIQFSEPVLPGSGTVVIRNVDSNSLLCSIPVTSNAIVGGGTNTITITPCTSFGSNTNYAVQIGSLAFTDLSGNAYAGIASTDVTTWRFRVSQDTTPPELVTTTPSSSSNSVKPNAVLSMTFSEPVQLNSANATAVAMQQTTNGTSGANIQLKLAVSATDARIVTLTPVTPFLTTARYVVNVPAGIIVDLASNPYPGILNDYRWTFSTLGTDTTPPSFVSAAIDGSAVVLTYNEDLDETSVPYASNYYVTVNDVPRQVNGVTIQGKFVRLSLQSGVTVGQTVKVSYTLGSQTLKDLSGNVAPAFNSQPVSNTSDTTLPRPASGIVSGSTLTLTFNKSLTPVSAYAASQFTVKLNGVSQSISSVSSSGANVVLTLYGTAIGSQSVSVSYTPGSYKLLDLSGNTVAAFTDFYIQNANDVTPPQLTSGTAAGNIITLNYNEGLLTTSTPLKSSFSVLVGGSAATVTAVTVGNSSVTLSISQTILANQAVMVTYIPGNPPIADLAGNAAAPFYGYSILAGSTVAAKLSTIAINNNIMTLTYSSALSSSMIPYNSQYAVKADGGYFGVAGVTVSGTQVIVTLTAPAKSGQSITASYTVSGNPLKDSLNQTVDAFNDIPVTNQNSSIVGLPDYVEKDGGGGLLLNMKGSTTTSGTMSSGKTVTKYNLDGDKFTQAFTAVKTAIGQGTITQSQLVFRIPQSEAGALISLPIVAMANASYLNANATLRLEYGDLAFTLPLNAINYSQEVSANGGDLSSSTLLLRMEKLANTSLASALNNKGIQTLTSTADFTASVVSGGREKTIEDYGTYVTRTFTISGSNAAPSDVTVVRLDAASGDVVYVPTQVDSTGSTLKVNFMRKGNSVYAVINKSSFIYADMTSHWAKSDVGILAAKFIVKGPSSTTFAPEKKITRAEFAEFIARGLGLTGNASAASKFPDVGSGGANAAYIGAASKAGIVQGGTDGKFRPTAYITREEMATMILRAMSYTGTLPTVSGTELAPFTDRAQVSAWARDAVLLSIHAGMMNGVTTTQFKPKDNTTRAQAAVIVKRLLEYVDLL